MRWLPFASLLNGCVTLSHVPPETRDIDEQLRSVVDIRANCAGEIRNGTGVVISERHVLTAGHVTSCYTIPSVRVKFADGHVDRMAVTREDLDEDIARLELIHAGRIGMNLAPPALGDPHFADQVCVALVRPYVRLDCGTYLGQGTFSVGTYLGASGAPVYDQEDRLAGLVSEGDGVNYTRFVPVTAEWLDGT